MDTALYNKLTSEYLDAIAKEWSILRFGDSEIPLLDVYLVPQILVSLPSRSTEQPEAQAESKEPVEQTTQSKVSIDKTGEEKKSIGKDRDPQTKLLQPHLISRAISLQTALKEATSLVLLGGPGSGKSTTLQFVGLCFAQQDETSNLLRLEEHRIPIKLDLKRYARKLAQPGPQLEDALVVAVNDFLRIQHSVAKNLVRVWQSRGQLLVLLDGLDEVADNLRVSVRDEVRYFSLATNNRKSRLIVSSRINGQTHIGFPFQEYTIKPFETTEEAKPYIKRWLAILESEGNEQPRIEVYNLLHQMESHSGLRRILDNPLLLRLAAEVYVKQRVLVQNRKELYQSYIDEAWKGAIRRGAQSEEKVQTFTALEFLAWHLHTTGNLDEATGVEVLMNELQISSSEANLSLLLIIDKMGIVSRVGNQIFFSHAGFQDYFVAIRLAKYWKKFPGDTWSFLLPRLHHTDWFEPLLMLVELVENPANLIRKVLRANGPLEWDLHRDLLLSARLASERENIDALTIHKITQKLESVIFRWQLFAYVITLLIILPPLLIALLPDPVTKVVLGALFTIFFLAIFIQQSPRFRSLLLLPFRVFVQRGKINFIRSLQYVGDLATAPLLRALSDVFPSIREAAATVLANSSREEVQKRFLEELIKRNARREKKSTTLESIIDALRSAWSIEGEAIQALGRNGNQRAVPHLVQAFKYKYDTGLQIAAAKALGEIGDLAIEILIVTSVDYDVQPWIVVEGLGNVGTRASDVLLRILGRSLEGTLQRKLAIRSLGQIGDPRAIDLLLKLLHESRTSMRSEHVKAIRSLRQNNIDEYLYYIKEEIHKSDQAEEIIEALGNIGDSRVLTPLFKTFNEIDLSSLRRSVLRALGKIRSLDTVEFILRQLETDDKYTKLDVIVALGEIGDARALEPLLRQMQHDDRDVRRVTVDALGKIRDSRATEDLLDILNADHDSFLQQSVIIALGEIGDPRAVEYLIHTLCDTDDEKVRSITVTALIQIGKPSIPALLGVLLRKAESKLSARINFIRHLGERDALMRWLDAEENKSSYVKATAAKALGQIADAQAVDPLIKKLEDRDAIVRAAAAEALGQIKDLRAVNPLHRRFRDRSVLVREAAILAIENVAPDVSNIRQVGRLAHSLWWLLTDPAGESACRALQAVLARKTKLEIAQIPYDAIPLPKPMLPWRWRVLGFIIIFLLMGTAALLFTLQDTLNDVLKPYFLATEIGNWVIKNPIWTLVLFVAAVGIAGNLVLWAIDRIKERVESRD